MSNIEPTCSSCGHHATVVDPRNDAWRCVDYPKCDFPKPTNIEPTEEQKQAAKKATEKVLGNAECCKPAYRVARLLAEREAKLREELEGERSLSEQLFSTNGTLRARVAELEAKANDVDKAVFAAQGVCRQERQESIGRITRQFTEREAQHLADIRDLLDVLSYVPHDSSANPVMRDEAREVLARYAHYDDAKAAEGGEG